VKRLVIAILAASLAKITVASGSDEAKDKRFIMEFRQADGTVSGVELVVAGPADADVNPIQLLEKRVGLKWSGFIGGIVYRFNERSRDWEPVMSRDLASTETRVGKVSGLKISELKTGDVLILYPPSP
jgi:hypothetical protein